MSSTEHLFSQAWLLLQDTSRSKQEGKSHLKNKSDKNHLLLHKDEVSPVYHEPFIITGYRRTGTSVLGSIRYAFVLHNDVGNFWTHFVPFVIWVSWLVWLAVYHIDFTDPYYYPLLCFWAGSCSYTLFSSVAHLFSNISFNVRSVCFILDYLGIAMYALGGAINGFFHEQSVNSPFYKYQGLVLSLDIALAINATLFSGLSRFYWKKFRFLIRTMSFFLPYVAAVAPFAQRLTVCLSTGSECVHETLVLHFSGFLLTFTLAFFFVTKIPERFYPGKFDYFFQSHQLFHVIAAIQTCVQMYMLPLDVQIRREALQQVEAATPTFYNTFLPYLVAQVGGLVVVAVMGVLIVRGVLVCNKIEHPSKKYS